MLLLIFQTFFAMILSSSSSLASLISKSDASKYIIQKNCVKYIIYRSNLPDYVKKVLKSQLDIPTQQDLIEKIQLIEDTN